MLISVHIPKTAGSSFRASLESCYGNGLRLDYDGLPVNQRASVRRLKAMASALRPSFDLSDQVRCIHGHFLPLKYRWLRCKQPRQFVIWLRDLIERLASHYYYWLRNYQREQAGPLRIRMVEEGWSLERFCFSPEMRNLYSEFLWGFPYRRFDFVGVVENYESDFCYFSERYLGRQAAPQVLNTNPEKVSDRYIEAPGLRAELERFHARDMRLYRVALDASNDRCV